MNQPVTEPASGSASEQGPWLAESGSPLLALAGDRIDAPDRPERLAWNTLRTLALWNADAWVPPLLEVACGADNRLSPLEWAEGSVVPWAANLTLPTICDVVLDGNEAYVVLACTLVPDPSDPELRAAAMAALDGSVPGARAAGLVVVAPPGSDGLVDRLQTATDWELHDGRRAGELLAGALGWISWPELGRLALDMAEENDAGPAEQVRQLVGELQSRFPEATW